MHTYVHWATSTPVTQVHKIFVLGLQHWNKLNKKIRNYSMTSCFVYCTSVTNKEFPGFRSSPTHLVLLVLKMRFSVCLKSLISISQMGFTLSTRNTKELGYCFWIWIKSASHRLDSAIHNKRSKRSYKAKGSMQSVNTITSYWQAVTEAQKWPVTDKFTWGWHITATGIWVGNRLKKIGSVFHQHWGIMGAYYG